MEKLGAIDIGSNSIRLLIASVENGRIVNCFKELEMARIGMYVGKTRKLSEEAIKRNIQALDKLISIAEKEGITKMPIIATSAVRDAENREDFIKSVKKELGRSIEVVTGKREAELGFSGVIGCFNKKDENILVVDVGGGSTEFIFGNASGIEYIVSLDIGCVRLTDDFDTKDNITESQMQKMVQAIDQTLCETVNQLKKFQIDRVIGIGGTITTLACVVQELEIYDSKQIHNFDLCHEQVTSCLKQFFEKNLKERKQIVGMYPKRADVITAGTAILERILTLLDKDAIRVSEYDNLEGLILEQILDR